MSFSIGTIRSDWFSGLSSAANSLRPFVMAIEWPKLWSTFALAKCVSFLLLSAQAKASGANLQCATSVILLDPAGSSAKHGAALEQQAIGRAVRMGQDRPVTVTRFCVTGTMEETLFQEIDAAALTSRQNSNDASYVIEGAHTELPVAAAAKSESTGDENGNDVEITESLSATERIQREFVQAKEGLVVDLVDSDDEHTEPTATTDRVVAAMGSSQGGLVSVKVEPPGTSTGKRQAFKMNYGCSEGASPSKRVRESPNHVVTDTPPAVESTEPPPSDAVTPEPAANVSPSSSQDSSRDSAMESETATDTTPICRSSLSTVSEESEKESKEMLESSDCLSSAN